MTTIRERCGKYYRISLHREAYFPLASYLAVEKNTLQAVKVNDDLPHKWTDTLHITPFCGCGKRCGKG